MRATTHAQTPLRLGFIGWGAINRRVAELLKARLANKIAFVAVCLNDINDAVDIPSEAALVMDPGDLKDIELDFMVEAAGRIAVAEWGEVALRQAGGLAVASVSAFCEDVLLEKLLAIAEANGSQVLVPSGALAGIDAVAAASALTLDTVTHRIVKPPAAWRGTQAERLVDLDYISQPETFFAGSARDAAMRFPQNANVSAIAALSGVGLDRTEVELVADPHAEGNRHELVARGDFGKMSVTIENRPLAANPKSSELAALSLVRLVENRILPFVC